MERKIFSVLFHVENIAIQLPTIFDKDTRIMNTSLKYEF